MFEFILSKQHLLLSALLAIFSGVSIRLVLTLIGQKWAGTFHQTMSYVLLPLITFVITKVISGNIALSLGMIGALSIVRFRNPVKSPFELVVFFALITVGITISVNLSLGVMFVVFINAIILAGFFLEKVLIKFGWQIYSLSFEEGNVKNIIEVQSCEPISLLHKNNLLVQYSSDNQAKEHFYRLASNSKKEIEDIHIQLNDIKAVNTIDLRFS